MNTDTIIEHKTTIDFGQRLEAMIAAGKYDWKDDAITARKFPIEGTGIKTFCNKLFHFDRDISSKDAMAAIKKEGFEPATHVHGLAFGAAFPDEQRKYPIICLGSSAQVSGGRGVVCLDGDDAERHLSRWAGGWRDYCRFLGVREVSGA